MLTRRHAAVLFAIAAWNLLSYANFARNLYAAYASGEDRAPGYYVAHIVLIVVNLGVAAVLARWGWRAWQADQQPRGREQEHSGAGGS
jgi:hypothetical protein